jgi:hypothetical protein
MESYNNKSQILEDMESIEVGWSEISDIFGTTRYSLYTCKYHGLQNMLIVS